MYQDHSVFDEVERSDAVAPVIRPVGFSPARKNKPVGFSPAPACKLFGLSLVNGRRDDIADMLVLRALVGSRTTVSFVNAHCANVLAGDADYAAALKSADLILPDGGGVRIAAKLAGQKLGENLNGTDLFPDLCGRAAYAGLPIFLLGGEPGVADAAASEMRSRYPQLKVAGTHHGFFGEDETAAVLGEINRSQAALVFVGFGVPMQEKWIARHRAALEAPVLLGVGGLFDYYSGRIPRAPAAMRRIGCEWAWRLYQEPRRLAKRYLLGNAEFLVRAAAHALVARGVSEAIGERVKRVADVAMAVLAMLLLGPVLLAAALAIKLEDGGPVLFRQIRIGRDGKPFTMFKFRSMSVDAEHRRAALVGQSERDDTCFKMKRDPRITRVGRLIRRLSIDELPQLINVAGGTMSMVGPRPALPGEVVTYRGDTWGRLGGKPGITCTWQVSGRAEIPFEQQVEMDIAYLRDRRVTRDLGLLLRTVPAVLGGRGAY